MENRIHSRIRCIGLLLAVLFTCSEQAFALCRVSLESGDGHFITIEQGMFPNGFSQTFKGVETFMDKVKGADFDLKTAIFVVRTYAGKKRLVFDEFGDAIGYPIRQYSPEGLWDHMTKDSSDPWSDTEWNNEIALISFTGACQGARVYIYKDSSVLSHEFLEK